MNHQGIQKVIMVTTLEGNGTNQDPFREVHTIYDNENNLIGVIDTIAVNESGRNLQNAING